MEIKRIKRLLKQKESITLEFKEAVGGLPASVYESVCAFLNREGGDIFLGVDDNGKIRGINPETADKMASDIASSLNNPLKLDPPFLLFPRKLEINKKTLLYIQVPCSSRIHKASGIVYDRSADGDFSVKDAAQIAAMVNRKAAYYSETKVYPEVDMKSLDKNTIKKARQYIELHSEDHPWLSLKDDEMLKAAGLLQKNSRSGKESLTLAAILLFGKEQTIQSALPQYKTDALLKIRQLDRYDDRIDIRLNLIESFLLLMSFVARHLPDPFYMESNTRISLRDKIFREVVANMLVHREYTSGYAGRFIIYKERVEAVNPCIPHYKGRLHEGRLMPFQKNPLISKFFLQMGWVEEIGSGMYNIAKYLPEYTAQKGKVEYTEEEIFKTEIWYSEPQTKVLEKGLEKVPDSVPEKVGKRLREKGVEKGGAKPGLSWDQVGTMLGLSRYEAEKLFKFCIYPKSAAEAMKIFGRTNRTKFKDKYIKPMVEKGLLEMTSPDKPKSSTQKYFTSVLAKELLEKTLYDKRGGK